MKTNSKKPNNNELILNAAREKNLHAIKKCFQTSSCSLGHSDKDGLNALHIATLNNDLEMVKYLINQKVDINSRSNLNRTPLHYACQHGYYEIVKYLIENDSDINATDFLDMTPLHLCTESNNTQIAKLLCKNKNINVNLCDKFDRTIYNLACLKNNHELIKILDNLKNELNKEPLTGSSDSDLTTGLAEFYKKKSFARPLNKSAKMTISSLYDNIKTDANKHVASNSTRNAKTDVVVIDDISSDSDGDDMFDTSKKKRLSTSPFNLVESSLNWMTNQSSLDLSKFELSLTEAGKLALDSLNKNDSINDENRLLMKLINDFESNQEKIDDEMDDETQELEETLLNLINNTETNDDDLKMFDNFSFF